MLLQAVIFKIQCVRTIYMGSILSNNTLGLQAKSLLEQGIKFHQKGRISDAEKIYKKILSENPNHFDSLNLLSEILIQSKNYELAKTLLTRAAKERPEHSNTQFNLAIVFEKLGDISSAVQHYTFAISLNSTNIEALYNRAGAYAKLGQLKNSLNDLNRVLKINPKVAVAINSKKEILKALDTKLQDTHLEESKHDQTFRDLHDTGLNQLQSGNYMLAIDYLNDALSIHPDNPEAHHNKGMALEKIGEFEAAVQSYKLAIHHRRESAATHNNLGNTLRELSHLNEAINSFEEALKINPNYPEALNNLGWTHYIMRNFSKAKECYQKAIAIDSELNAAYFNLGLCNLMLGEFTDGWKNYEYRKYQSTSKPKHVDNTYWLGKAPVANKSIYVYFEQGLGDTIQFCRYIKLLADKGAKVFFRPQPELLTLLSNLEGVTELIASDRDSSQFDFHCSLMSLPLAFQTDSESIPSNIPYLTANKTKAKYWQSLLSNITGPKVGLIWNGGFRSKQPELWSVNNRRNISFDQISKLNSTGINYFSLQKGGKAENEIKNLQSHLWPLNNFYNYSNELNDFSDTAALISCLDLIISVDTSTAHLAAAMGKPVWILNRHDNCWRWLEDGDHSLWYPTARLYRQKISGEWDTVIEDVKKDLITFFN